MEDLYEVLPYFVYWLILLALFFVIQEIDFRVNGYSRHYHKLYRSSYSVFIIIFYLGVFIFGATAFLFLTQYFFRLWK